MLHSEQPCAIDASDDDDDDDDDDAEIVTVLANDAANDADAPPTS
jgi:hypothetical protein